MNFDHNEESFSVLIPDGESNYALSVLQCLSQKKNVRLFILSDDPWARVRFSRYPIQFISYTNVNGNEDRLTAITDAVKKTRADVVLPVDSQTMRLLSSNPGTLLQMTTIIPVPKIGDMDIAEDKWLLYLWLNENSIPCPSTILYRTDDGFDQELSKISFPVLIKPRKGSGGVGIEFFDNSSALYGFCKEHVKSEEFIIQYFINGYDIDCSVLCKEGKILSYTIQKGFLFEDKKVSWPSGIDFLYDLRIYNVVKDLVEKFNWSGIVHIDLRYDQQEDRVKVIEMNPRFWATVCASTFAGVNFPFMSCLAALKKNFPENEFQPKRVVRSGAAIKLLAKRILNRKQKDLYFDHSFIEFSLRDPLPHLVSRCFKVYNKYFSKKSF
ncbi:MAG: ATP-grasp domain-containing protein [Bacteroidota bacterium]|nr:ATP-grasp domain-containing protein [Bacteroidota bacterium]